MARPDPADCAICRGPGAVKVHGFLPRLRGAQQAFCKPLSGSELTVSCQRLERGATIVETEADAQPCFLEADLLSTHFHARYICSQPYSTSRLQSTLASICDEFSGKHDRAFWM